MSVNVYLKGEKVRKVDGFEVIEPKEKDGSRKQYRLPGLDLSYGKGRWYFMLYEPNAPIPLIVANIVEEVSFHTWIPSSPRREAGIYRYESAEAEVEFPKENSIWVCIKAEKMEDLSELFRKIRIGSIRPDESYEGEQDGMSCVQLKKELNRLQQERAGLEFSLDKLSNQLAAIQDERSKRSKRMLPRCRNWLVATYKKVFRHAD